MQDEANLHTLGIAWHHVGVIFRPGGYPSNNGNLPAVCQHGHWDGSSWGMLMPWSSHAEGIVIAL
jgi:hypothetical protein